MNPRTLVLLLGIALLPAAPALSQSSPLQISLKAAVRGELGQYEPDGLMPESPRWAANPELELIYSYRLPASAFSLQAGASWAYLDDGVRELREACGYAGCTIWVPAAYHVLGARTRLTLQDWALSLPLSVSIGLARHLPKQVYNGAVPRVLGVREAQPYTAIETGFEAALPISRVVALQLGLRQYRRWPLSRPVPAVEMLYSGVLLRL